MKAAPSARAAQWRERRLRRLALLPRLGIELATRDLVRRFIDEALPARDASALDAGCGRRSHLEPFRDRISELVAIDIHPPAEPLPWADRFAVADVCVDRDALAPDSFDLVLSSFTVEHFADPPAAFRVIHGWLRPGGWLVITTVNRAHPFVNAYLSAPSWIRGPLQRFVKLSAADAHPLVGTWNTLGQIRAALSDAGYQGIELQTSAYLSKAWGNRLPGFVIGLAGDLMTRSLPTRRSTIVGRARKPR
ncbi:MAG: class I SAM-dependent methyltransferase [Chloroflexi bacterium]|nr:class I SAM-dependent methyltransferase [Chloroflexota bacterium]